MIAPEFASYLMPQSTAPTLGVIAQLGVILYMFVVGLELDPDSLKERGHTTIAISHASIVVGLAGRTHRRVLSVTTDR
jgi:Kef-type K+ transport system membrane component KefB